MDPSNSQSTGRFCVCLLCGYRGAAVGSFDPLVILFLMKLWSAGCTVKFSLPLSLPCAVTCVCVHAHTRTHIPTTPQSTGCNYCRLSLFSKQPTRKDFLSRCCSLSFSLILYFSSSNMHWLQRFWNFEIGMHLTINGYWDLLKYDKGFPWVYLYVCEQI